MLLAVPYDIGLVVAFFVFGARAGFGKVGPNFREFLIPNPLFFAQLVGKSFTWPLVLGYWLYQGSPPSPWRAVTEINGREARAVRRTAQLERASD